MKNTRIFKQQIITTQSLITIMVFMMGGLSSYAQSFGSTTGTNRDTYVINNDRTDFRSEVRLQNINRAFTFSNLTDRMALSYAPTYTGWQNKGTEVFSVSTNGNTIMNNSFVGERAFGPHWASFGHKSLGSNGYSILSHQDGSRTLINKKNTGNGYIGFRVGNVDKMVLTNDGNLGIGINSPTEKLDVNGNTRINGNARINGDVRVDNNTIYLRAGNDKNHGLAYNAFSDDFTIDGPVLYGYAGGALGTTSGGSNKSTLVWTGGGNVGIGTRTPIAKLHVDGNTRIQNGSLKIGDSELSSSTVDNNTILTVNGGIKTDKVVLNIGTFPDYVFADEYALMPIGEVAEYINENKHLPNIPSEKEIVATGLDVRMISVKLVEKVEELTLYTIQQEEKLKSQDQLINELVKRLERLENKGAKQ